MVAVHADFTTPSEPVFKEMLKNYALRIQEHTLTSLKGEVVSILIDGAKKCTREFEGVILYSRIGLKFFALVNIPNQKAMTLASVISAVDSALSRNGTRVVSICSDNAKTNKKALNCDESSAQSLSGFFFIRQGCSVHSINLAIGDVFNMQQYIPLLNALKNISKFIILF